MGGKYCFPVVNATCPSAFLYFRELLFENPLESLPKCTPHPPAIVQVLNTSSQVATVSKVSPTDTR